MTINQLAAAPAPTAAPAASAISDSPAAKTTTPQTGVAASSGPATAVSFSPKAVAAHQRHHAVTKHATTGVH
jgi:hypothetical protein